METIKVKIQRVIFFQLTLFLWCSLSLAVIPSVSLAQSYDNPGLGERPVVTHPQDFKPLGIRAGGFMLHPGVALAAEYSDNIFYTTTDQISDTIWHVRPYITAQSNWNKHAFNVRLAADIGRYQDFSFRDYEDYFLLISGRMDVLSRSYFSYSLDYMQLHEDLNSRNSEQGVTPTVYTVLGGSLGYDHTFNRLSLGALFIYRELDYDNAFGLDGEVIDNQDRNRSEGRTSFRMGYQFQTDKQAFVSFAPYKVKYDEMFDRNGFDRSSDGYSVNTGLAFTKTGVLNGDVFASYHNETFDDPRLNDIDGWAAGMSLQWRPTMLTSVGASITSGIQATTYQYSSGYFMTLYTVRVDHELLRDLQINGQVSYRDNEYQLLDNAPEGARSNDQIWRAAIGMSYFFNRSVSLSASYDYGKLTSNVPLDEYDVNRVWLVLTLER